MAMNKKISDTTKFKALESEWMNRRSNVINNINIFLATVAPINVPSFCLNHLPIGNVNKDLNANKCEDAWFVLCEAIGIFETILDDMDDIINNARNRVGNDNEMAIAQVIDRGYSGNASSSIDMIQIMNLKYNMYRNDCTLIETILLELKWDNINIYGESVVDKDRDDVNEEEDSSSLQSLTILLDINPCIDKTFMETINYHLSLNDQIRNYEKSAKLT